MLAVLAPAEDERLLYRVRRRVLLAHNHLDRLPQHRVHQVLDRGGHRRREEAALHRRAIARGEHLVALLEEPELVQLVRLVQHQVLERRERLRALAQQRHPPQRRAQHHVVPAPHAAGRAAAARAAAARAAAFGRRELLGDARSGHVGRAGWPVPEGGPPPPKKSSRPLAIGAGAAAVASSAAVKCAIEGLGVCRFALRPLSLKSTKRANVSRL